MRTSVEIYPKAAVERAMKVQEVILRAMAKKLTWYQAAEIIGISDRQMRRWRERYEEHGYDGLMDRRRGMPSGKRVPLAQAEQVLGLYRDRYFDLNVRHFHEKLTEEHQIGLSYTWVKQALQGAGLVKREPKRGVHRKRRERRPLPGMLLISTLAAANSFLAGHYVAEFNRRFQVPAAQRGTAFVACPRKQLDLVFSLQFERAVNKDNTVSFQNLAL